MFDNNIISLIISSPGLIKKRIVGYGSIVTGLRLTIYTWMNEKRSGEEL